MSTIKSAVIAAAGIGSRLGLGHPKCLIEIGGKSLLQHLLENLKDVQDIRIVTGFMAPKVIENALEVRKDIIFVQNNAFRSTTTLTSYVMGAKGCTENVLYMDADIYFTPHSFSQFIAECAKSNEPLLAVTAAKTQDCVYVQRDELSRITEFSRTKKSDAEWANLAFLPPQTLQDANTSVFEHMEKILPCKSTMVESFEVDTASDYALLNDYFEKNL